MHHKKLISGLLRVGVAFSFLYPAIDSFFHPNTWVGFFPSWFIAAVPFDMLTLSVLFSVLEIVIATGILIMPRPIIPAISAILVLGVIIVFDWSALDIVFRDVSILLMALALIVLHKKYHY